MKQLLLMFYLLSGLTSVNAACGLEMADAIPLTRETIKLGIPIYARSVTLIQSYPERLLGCYLNVCVDTYNGDFSGDDPDEQAVGMQIIVFSEKDQSVSKWGCREVFNGKKYVVHYHDGFCVYSSKDEQFFIAR